MKQCLMPENAKLVVAKRVNIPDIHCVLHIDFYILPAWAQARGVSRSGSFQAESPFVSELISGSLNLAGKP